MNFNFQKNDWALILGGSSGFGLAAAKKLSKNGMSVCIIHRDRRGSMERINNEFDLIKQNSGNFLALNLDALSIEGMNSVIIKLKEALGTTGTIKLLLHSIAFGNLKPIVNADPTNPTALIEEEDLTRTINAMGSSLLTWTQRLHTETLFASSSRVIGLTSEGNSIAWEGYAAVSAAKCALESISRSIAVEFAPFGIRSNILQPGVTDTPALKLIPSADKIKETAIKKNPFKRLTEPEDVANVIALLCTNEASWINGALIHVDGGEHASGC